MVPKQFLLSSVQFPSISQGRTDVQRPDSVHTRTHLTSSFDRRSSRTDRRVQTVQPEVESDRLDRCDGRWGVFFMVRDGWGVPIGLGSIEPAFGQGYLSDVHPKCMGFASNRRSVHSVQGFWSPEAPKQFLLSREDIMDTRQNVCPTCVQCSRVSWNRPGSRSIYRLNCVHFVQKI